ncbi:MAG: hypothetical protein RBS39_05840 [Phycisphaerales bacterium]|jgi:hypothetical protein|nr:hypothetical protein [Phycisphaerales bacterium]
MSVTRWLFSLIRSGSSATAYAAGHALRFAVADEPFGPWDRTGDPYRYPAEQARLAVDFKAGGKVLTPAIVHAATRVIAGIERTGGEHGGRALGVIVKIPHDRPLPEDVRATWPAQRHAYLFRNPLHRLNSIWIRGWFDPPPIDPDYDVANVKRFAALWARDPNRARYDDLKRDPDRFFGALFAAWGMDATRDRLDRARAYAAQRYHHASGNIQEDATPQRVLSESRRALPREAVDAYLSDPEIRAIMREAGWSTRAEDYVAPPGVDAPVPSWATTPA